MGAPDRLSRAAYGATGYLFTYWHTKKADERKAYIERINEQLRELYGPLLACITATRSAYNAMVQSCDTVEGRARRSTGQSFRDAVQADATSTAAKSYRQWMKYVLQPLNEQAAELIMKRLDLLEAGTTSDQLLAFVAHVTANRVVLKQWEAGKLDAHSSVPFPDELVDMIIHQFGAIKAEQARALGVKVTSRL